MLTSDKLDSTSRAELPSMRGGRRLDLDRLRTIACLTTFCYHAIQIFDLNPYYHVKSNTPSAAIDVAARLLHAVRMPLFFLIAGMVGFLLLQRTTDAEFLRQRAARLLPPFLIGIVFLTPWIKYLEVLDGRSIGWHGAVELGRQTPDMLVVLRRYFTQFRWFSWSHMWFPLYLFLLGTVLLPAMRWLARTNCAPGRAAATAVAAPLAVLIAIELALRPYFPWHIPNLFWDWASMAVYATCLLAGACLIRWPEVEAVLRRRAGLIAFLGAVGIWLYVGTEAGAWPSRGIGRALWLWAALCLALAASPLLSRGRIVGERYLSEGALPIYVLHHLPLVTIGYFVKDLSWPIWQRYAAIVLGAFVVTLGLYQALVRPFAKVRLAFGMAPARRSPRAQIVVAAANP